MGIDLEYIRSFRNGQTDAEIIGDAKQSGDEWFVDHHDTYAWYRAIGRAKKPKSILELGVRYGYALIAMAKGAMSDNLSDMPVLYGIDSEFDGIPSNKIARGNIIRHVCFGHGAGCPHKILKQDTQDTGETTRAILDHTSGVFGITHVDGNHSPEGIRKELFLALMFTAYDGWILIDDIDTPHVFKAAVEFAAELEKNSVVIPTYHGMLLVDMGNSK